MGIENIFSIMPIIEPAIRPPSEAESILIQVTTGCSANTCTFCGGYVGKKFSIKSYEEIFSDIDYYAEYYPQTIKKLFLMDGDALVLNNNKLLPILKRIHNRLSWVSKISSYANGFNITRRSKEELIELYNHKLKVIYMGLESGSQEILTLCNKKATVDEMVKAVHMTAEVNIKTSLILLLGLGGKKRSKQHIIESAEAINKMQPYYLSFLSLMLVTGTELHDQAEKGEFEPLDSKELLIETYEILKRLDLKQTLFFCNHASNYLPLTGRLPMGKDKLLQTLDEAIKGEIGLKPEIFRGL
jgi:radical SAM superfamily enzyme YgiQ (UPF0313 family)